MNERSIEKRLMKAIKDMTEDQQRNLLNYIEKNLSENRKHPRKECAIASAYFIQDKIYTDLITDISSGGVHITAKESPSVGDEISVNFVVSGQKRPIRLLGKIIRSSPDGFAVKFFDELEEVPEK